MRARSMLIRRRGAMPTPMPIQFVERIFHCRSVFIGTVICELRLSRDFAGRLMMSMRVAVVASAVFAFAMSFVGPGEAGKPTAHIANLDHIHVWCHHFGHHRSRG